MLIQSPWWKDIEMVTGDEDHSTRSGPTTPEWHVLGKQPLRMIDHFVQGALWMRQDTAKLATLSFSRVRLRRSQQVVP